MAEKSGFFDAHLTNGEYDRVYLADNFARYFASFVGNGVFGGKSNELMVRQNDTANMNIKVLSGQGWINGYWYENTDEVSLAIDIADGVLNRIDIVVLRWDNIQRVIRLAVKKGTPATNPSMPAIQRDSDYYELKLANVYIKAGATNITQANITDTRLDYSFCGLVQGVIKQFDTTEFGIQINSFIEQFKADNLAQMQEFFDELNTLITQDVAANLVVDVSRLKEFFVDGLLPVKFGGTGASAPSQARTNIGAASDELAMQYQINTLDGSTNFDNVTSHGIYWVNTWTGTGGSNYPNGQDSGWLIVHAGMGKAAVTQIYYSSSGYVLKRSALPEAALGAWEWENPPTITGVEYRTTERWNGKPVYKRNVWLGSLPNTDVMVVKVAANYDKIVAISGYAINNNDKMYYPFPIIIGASVTPSAVIVRIEDTGLNDGWIAIRTTANMTSYTGYVDVRYVKS